MRNFMNKIFKVIYSKTRHCYVVVSELAKSHCKTTQSHTARSKTALTAAVLLALGAFSFVGMPVVQAADGTESLRNNDFVGANDQYWYYDEDKGEWTTYQYKLTSAFNNRARGKLPNYQGGGAKFPGAVTAGLYAQAGQQTVTIGDRNAGQSKGSVFIGEHSGYNNGNNDPAGMKNNYVTSVGFQSDATGWGSIAIGSNATAENSKMESQVVKEVGNANTSGTVSDDTYGIEENPTIQGASVALGYNAHSKDGNIAIGAYSDAMTDLSADTSETAKSYLTKESATSYVSVGSKDVQRRISNVADGAADSDVATVGQLMALEAKSGTYKAGFGIEITPDTAKKENTISLDRNLGNDYNNTDNVNLKNDAAGTSLILGGRVEKGSPTGGQSVTGDYGALGRDSVTVGGVDNTVETTGDAAVVVGGIYNKAAGTTSAVVGGSANDAIGNESSIFGGFDNDAFGAHATLSGGSMNKAYGEAASVFGGGMNSALGASSVAVGGLQSTVNGAFAVGIAGGSTNAGHALAAGNGANVTVENGTAIGYQATTDEANTIAFGHDAGDVSGYTIEWNKLSEGQVNADGTTNDYTQAPKSVTPTTYKDAYYNRLVKVADGQDAHDVVVMEQLTKATNDLTKDLSVNAGWGINVADEKDTTGKVTKNVISLNRNLGTNYGNPWKGEGKVTFEAGGENSMILGGAASILFNNEGDNVKAGAYGKDSVLVGGFNNLIDTVANDVTQTGENAVIVGGDTNTVTGRRSVIVGGYQNKVSGGHSIVVGGELNETDGGGAGVFGGQSNKAAGGHSSVLGGDHNEADGDWSSAIGGTTNTASGRYATTLGGINNDAKGNESVVVGGAQNVAIGKDSTVNGGARNISYGMSSYVAGGMNNIAFGNASVALGGIKSNVNAKVSTGIAGGSTEEKAITALAAGHQSVVTNSGVEWRKATQEDFDAINQKLPSWSGFIDTEPEDPYTTYVLDKVSTAVGYQSTADAPGVIAFGHDKGDVASVAKKWKQKATMEVDNDYSVKYYDANHKEISADDYYKLANADGTLNDYTQDPIGTENTTYQSAYYNRLVKAADGIDAHDAVVMEQLKPYTKSDASNVGANLKTYTVGDDGETITETDATEDQKKANKVAWGKALGADTFSEGTPEKATDASTSDQLVTGKTLYNYDAPVAETGKTLNYVSANNTTGQNLSALDAQVKANADKGLKFAANSGAEYTAKLGSTVKIQGTEKKEGHEYTADNLTTEIDEKGNITILMDKDMSVEKLAVNGKDGKDGAPGSIGINGRDGKSGIGIDGKDGISIKGRDGKDGVTMKAVDGENGTEGHIGLTGPAGTNGKDGTNAIDITVKNGYDKAGQDGKDGINGKNGVDGTSLTRIVYTDGAGEHQVATMEDGLKFKGDDTTVINKKLNNTLDIIGGAKGDLTEGNIGVNNDSGKLKVQLAKDLTGITSISNQTTTKVGGKDVTTGAKITLGADGTTTISGGDVNVSGNKITHVGSGIEKDANGKYTVTGQNKGNAANIGDVQNMVNDAKTELISGDNGLNNKANIDASNIGANLKDEDGKTPASDAKKTANENAWGKAIGTGEIEANNGQLVTGNTVYNEVRPKEDGNYVKTNQTTGANLSALDSKIGKLDKTKEYNYIDSKESTSISDNLTKLDTQVKKNADDITNINNSISSLNQNAVKYDDSSKSKISLGGEGGTTITNVKDGSVKKDSTDAVNGGQLWQVDQKVDTNTTNITKNAGDITNLKNLSNITDAGKTVIKNLSKDAVQIKAGTAITVDGKVDETTGNKTYTISANNNGKVAKDDGNLISGDTLYKEVHVDSDGSYIKSNNTVGQNLSALDSGLKTTSDLIHTNAKGDTIQIGGNSTATKIDVSGKDKDGNTTGRVITGVMTDGKDLTSAANVGYVNGITSANTQQIYRDMNNAYSRLDTNINRAAAGSNALAALHPLDFDPADKASFAVGYGHYHNANAAAVGAFYQPNANTMVNMGISLGNGDPGFNAGVSFKIGKGSAYNGVSKAEMAQTIHDQAEEISAIKANDAAKDKRIDALEKENQEMKKQIQEILSRLNG